VGFCDGPVAPKNGGFILQKLGKGDTTSSSTKTKERKTKREYLRRKKGFVKKMKKKKKEMKEIHKPDGRADLPSKLSRAERMGPRGRYGNNNFKGGRIKLNTPGTVKTQAFRTLGGGGKTKKGLRHVKITPLRGNNDSKLHGNSH